MRIGDLGQHCGNCNVTEYCGNGFCFCLCTDPRFEDMEESEYKWIAEGFKGNLNAECCAGCEDYDHCDGCDNDDEARDFLCETIANHVAAHRAQEE